MALTGEHFSNEIRDGSGGPPVFYVRIIRRFGYMLIDAKRLTDHLDVALNFHVFCENRFLYDLGNATMAGNYRRWTVR